MKDNEQKEKLTASQLMIGDWVQGFLPDELQQALRLCRFDKEIEL